MALTIPYPDMDFVPLDVLTAEELDQMVANIEYIANCFPLGSPDIAEGAILDTKINNGAVTTQKIANGAVTSDKIDFTTMKTFTPDYSLQVTEITIPYTSTAHQFIRISSFGDVSGTVSINGRQVMNENTKGHAWFELKPGDNLTKTGTVSQAFLVPGKWS